MRLLTLALLMSSFVANANTNAQDVYSDEYNTIESVEMVEVIVDAMGHETFHKVNTNDFIFPAGTLVQADTKSTKGGVGEYIMVAREIIAFGKEVYKIIEAGKPVVTIGEAVPLSVLPKNEKGVMVDAFDLENWKMPKASTYRVIAKNGFGMKMISFDFMLIFTYGGTYNGKGAYITGAEVAPTNVEVAWGYSLDANFRVQSIVNQGTRTNVNAAAILQIDYTIKTVLKESRTSKKFMINGKGQTRAY